MIIYFFPIYRISAARVLLQPVNAKPQFSGSMHLDISINPQQDDHNLCWLFAATSMLIFAQKQAVKVSVI